MKSYTDLEQSNKLAEFLPLESAGMYYSKTKILNSDETDYIVKVGTPIVITDVPCWSLAALLDIIPYAIHKSDNEFYRLEIDKGYNYYDIWYSNNGLTVNDLDVTSDNFVDACVKMILKLNDLNLL